jgi:hypothetical protein
MGFNMHDEGWGRWVSANFEVGSGEEQRKESRKEGRKEDSAKTVQKMKFIVRNIYVK